VALKGHFQDGHDFLTQAFDGQASAALVREDYCESNRDRIHSTDGVYRNLIPVNDVEHSLCQLARWRRQVFQKPVIGITGSVGKTSTKEMLGYLLTKRWNGLIGKGNFNNELGLPINLIGLDSDHDFCLTELGASKPGDIRYLSDILKPSYAMITQISEAHLEGFGSIEAVYSTKLELAEALPTGGICVLPDFDRVLIEKAARLDRKFILVGSTEGAHYRVSGVRQEKNNVIFNLAGRQTYRIPAGAPFFAQNAAMAAALADQLGFALEKQPPVWEDFNLPAGRFECRRAGEGITLIYDGYNASPESFRRSIEGFRQMNIEGRKLVLFADMLELGTEKDRLHREIGKMLSEADFDLVGAYGVSALRALEEVCRGSHRGMVKSFESPEEAGDFFASELKLGDALLLKASRSMRIDKALKIIEEFLNQNCRQ